MSTFSPEPVKKNEKHWQRDLWVLCAIQFLTLTGFNAYMSFIAFYFQELGTQGIEETARWTALAWTLSSVALMVSSPIWGNLGDRIGQRKNLVRATFGGLIVVVLAYFVQTPTQFTITRVLQSTICGTVSVATALTATMVPIRELTKGLGLLQTTRFAAAALGPIVGGLIADAFSYRDVFLFSIVMMVIALVLALAFLPEYPVAQAITRQRQTFRDMLGVPSGLKATSTIMIATLAAMAFADFIISPIFALYVQELAPIGANLGTLTGALTAGTAIASSVVAILAGPLTKRIGEKNLLVISLLGVCATLIPQALVGSANQLFIWRILQGAFAGALIPTANAILGHATSPEARGKVYGVSASTQAAARIPASPLSAWMVAAISMPSVFILAAAVYGVLGLVVLSKAQMKKGSEEIRNMEQIPTPEPGCSTPAL